MCPPDFASDGKRTKKKTHILSGARLCPKREKGYPTALRWKSAGESVRSPLGICWASVGSPLEAERRGPEPYLPSREVSWSNGSVNVESHREQRFGKERKMV
jgi:hypothetical protein